LVKARRITDLNPESFKKAVDALIKDWITALTRDSLDPDGNHVE